MSGLSSAFSQDALFIGCGKSNSATIFTGFVYEATDDLNASFYMAGGFFIAAGIISQVAYIIQRFAKKKK